MVLKVMDVRRSVRFFSEDPVPLELIQEIVKTAGWKNSRT